MKRLDIVQTLNILSAAFMILYLLFARKWIFYIAAILLLLSILDKLAISKFIAKLWVSFGKWIGEINTKIILSIVFYFILTPVAFLYRFFNKEKIKHFKEDSKTSFFENLKTGNYEKRDFEKPG
ncbi:MAG: hypothetical protein KAI33_09890 [Elusimicrobiales bacterium]|nr:hypothetical protein [Elusimicrobiales bacterium]